jgi:hypothetical protein
LMAVVPEKYYIEILMIGGAVDGGHNYEMEKTGTVGDLKLEVQSKTMIDPEQMIMTYKMKGGCIKAVVLEDDALKLSEVMVLAGEPMSTRLQLKIDMTGGGTSGVFYGSIF